MGSKRVFVAGHKGMVGSAICRELERSGDCELVLKSRRELDLRDQRAVQEFFDSESIDQVYVAAAKVGGIHANSAYPADFICDNLLIQTNVINAAFRAEVENLLFLGSSCIYPRECQQPIKEEYLLSGYLEPTNEPYALAKIAGIKYCESLNRQYGIDYRCLMPCNLYGRGDNFHAENSHVIPGLITRFHDAKHLELTEVAVWGDGSAMREFLHVDDLASAALFTMSAPRDVIESATTPMCSHLNVGSGIEVSIAELSAIVKDIVGFEGYLVFDRNKPNGTPRKLLDSSKLLRMGWAPNVDLSVGIKHTYNEFKALRSENRLRENFGR